MSKKTEKRAEKYLISKFKNDKYKFFEKQPEEEGFDLWMENIKTKRKTKIELKSTEGKFSKNSDIFQKLCFNMENEVENFEQGITKILRIFMGNNPPRIFIFDKNILGKKAKFIKVYRATIKGKINYNAIEEI